MPTWIAVVKNTFTGEETTRIGENCPLERLAYNAVRAAEESTPVGELPDEWEISIRLLRQPEIDAMVAASKKSK